MATNGKLRSGCCLKPIKTFFDKERELWVGFCTDCLSSILEYNPRTEEEKLVGTLATAEQLADKRHQVKASLASHKWTRSG